METMPDHPEIYRSQAEQYDTLVSNEDYQNNLLPALQKLTSFNNKTVVEFGAGTGRVTCLLAPLVRSIHAFDISQHMLDSAIAKLKQSGLNNWQAEVADHREIPIEGDIADVIVSGWSVCYVVVDHPQTWKEELEIVFHEMDRLLRPLGRIILIETLGTGFTVPTPPEHLIEYYTYLESLGFNRTWIRTDYRFDNMETAKSLASFFFGDEMINKIRTDENGITLPECTGIWFL